MLSLSFHSHTTVLRVSFAQATYFGLESFGFISIMLLLRGGVSTDDITVTVHPFDQSPLSAEGKKCVS